VAYTAQPTGFLADVTSRTRLYLNDPGTREKWTTDRLWPLIVDAWQLIMDDVNGLGENRLIIQWTLSVTDTTQGYLLPGNFGKFMGIGRANEGTGQNDEVTVPRSYLNPRGPGIRFEGNRIWFEPFWGTSEDLVIEYIPNGHCPLHLGSLDMSLAAVTSTLVVLDNEPSEGYFDGEPNAYLGCVLRILSSDEVTAPSDYTTWPIQERIITGYDPETLQATLSPALDFDPATDSVGSCPYEVVPFLGYAFRGLVAWRVALAIAQMEPGFEVKRINGIRLEYNKMARGVRLRLSNMNARTGQRFHGDVPGNGRFGVSVGRW
jgi:hypothetical protein